MADEERPPVAVPFRLREAFAAPPGWPPDVLPNQLIASAHINNIRSTVYAWPGDVDGQNHKLKNVILENVTGAITDPTTAKGDLITRDAAAPAALTRLPVGPNAQVLTADSSAPAGMKWAALPAVGVSSVFGRAGVVTAQAGDYTAAQVTNAVSTAGSYVDPPWITSYSYSRLVGVPPTFPASPHTHAAVDIVSGVFSPARMGSGIPDATVFLRGDGTWSVPGGPGGVVPTARLVSAGYGLTGGGSLAADISLAVLDNTSIQKVRALYTPFGGAAGLKGARWGINFIEGSNVTISMVDDGANDRINVTIASAGGGGTGGAVASVFGRTGAVLAQAGDYHVSQVTNALADMTFAKGDMLARTTEALGRLPVGPDGQVLTADNAQPLGVKWAAPAAGGVSSVFGRVGIVTAQPGDYTAAQVTGAVVNPTTAKGDLMVRDATSVQRVPLGSNGFVLTADNAQPLGVKWAAVATGSAQTPWTQDINAAGFRLFGTGYVGIGEANPVYKCHITSLAGGASPSLVYHYGDAGFGLDATSNAELVFGWHAAAPYGYWMQVRNGAGLPLCFNPAGGNVGIAVQSPQRLLHIAGPQQATVAGASQLCITEPSGNVDYGISIGTFADTTWKGVIQIGGSSTALLINPRGGNVCVGGTAPNSMFNVQGGRSTFTPASERYAVGLQYVVGAPVAWIGSDLNGHHIFSESSGIEVMRIMSTAGVTTPGFVHAVGALRVGEALGAADYSLMRNPGDGYLYIDGTQTAYSGYVFRTDNGTREAFRIHNAGRLGVGTSTPFSKLSFGNTAPNINSRIALYEQSTGAGFRGIGMANPPSGYGVGIYALSTLAPTDTNMTLFVSDNGFVGINHTAPDAHLTVGGSINIAGQYLINGVPVGGGGVTTQNVYTPPTRTFGTVYRNTGTKARMVSIMLSCSSYDGSAHGKVDVYSDAAATPTTLVATTLNVGTLAVYETVVIWVLPGNYYRAVATQQTVGIATWVEWE